MVSSRLAGGKFLLRNGSKRWHPPELRVGLRSRARAARRQATWQSRPVAAADEGGRGQVRRPPLPKRIQRGSRLREAKRPDGPGRAACSTLSRDTLRSDPCSSRRGVCPKVRTRIQSGATAQPTLRDRQLTMLGDPGPRQVPVSIPIGSMRSDYQVKLHVTRLPWERRIAFAMSPGPRPVGPPAEGNSLNATRGSSPGPANRRSPHHAHRGVATARRLQLLDGLRGSSHSE